MKNTNLQPDKDYISRRLFITVTAYLDLKGYLTKVVKTRRVKNYFVYINGKIHGRGRATRHAVMRQVYTIFKKVVNDTFDITE